MVISQYKFLHRGHTTHNENELNSINGASKFDYGEGELFRSSTTYMKINPRWRVLGSTFRVGWGAPSRQGKKGKRNAWLGGAARLGLLGRHLGLS